MKERVWVGCDHGGYAMKREVVKWLTENGYEAVDCGCNGEEIVRYPYFPARVTGAVSKGEAPRGIFLCSTGIGMSIVANKYPGVRAALCADTYMARLTRMHNNSNVLCMGGKITVRDP